MTIKIVNLLVTFAGAIVVAWYWNQRKDQLERYQYLDESYNEILKTYFEYSYLGNADHTKRYASAFSGKDALQYHYFAMKVHTFLESVFDFSKGRIPDEWARIYRYHALLHSAWLKDHQELHEPGYVSSVLNQSPR